MLKTFKLCGHLPLEMRPLINTRKKEEGFDSDSEYIRSLVFYDLLVRKRHSCTAPLMREPQWIQDAVIMEIVREFDNADSIMAATLKKLATGQEHNTDKSWLEQRLNELILGISMRMKRPSENFQQEE